MNQPSQAAQRPRIHQFRVGDLPEGKSGKWTVKRYTVPEDPTGLSALRSAFAFGGIGRHVPPGEYTGLFRDGVVIMSDTPAEMGDLHELNLMSGHVLVGGLGLGAAVVWGLEHAGIERMTVIEKSADVIALTADHWRARFGDRLTILEADLFTWEPGELRFDFAWLDIWDDLNCDNLDEFAALREKFGEVVDGAIGCWSELPLMRTRGYVDWLEENDRWDELFECEICGWSHLIGGADECEHCGATFCSSCAHPDYFGGVCEHCGEDEEE